MKKTITQKMTEELKINSPLRTYFDSGSSQFNRTDMDEKIQTIGRIISSGYDLNKVIKQYKLNFSSDDYKHIYENAIPTLKMYISYLKSSILSVDLADASDEEVIELLTELLKEKVIKG